MSTVRCNAKRNLGFVATAERICVAFTRGKQGFVVFGDAATLYDGDKCGAWRSFLKTAATEGYLLQGKVAATAGVHACLNLKELERLEYSHLRNLVGQAPETVKKETADENECGKNKWEAMLVWGQSLQRFRVAGRSSWACDKSFCVSAANSRRQRLYYSWGCCRLCQSIATEYMTDPKTHWIGTRRRFHTQEK